MDDIDRAQEYQDRLNADALREHWRRQPIGIGLEFCEDCENEIPSRRRQAQPTCTKCIDCQQSFEMETTC